MRVLNDTILTSANSSTTLGSSIVATNIVAFSIQAVATGTPTGTLKVQVSNDPLSVNSIDAPTNWSDLSGATVNVTSSGSFLIPRVESSYQWIRAVYTDTGAGIQTITTVADSSGSLNNKYFFISAGNNGTSYYVWINVDSGGTDPNLPGKTGVEIDISQNDSNSTVAAAVDTALSGIAGTPFAVSTTDNVCTVTNSTSGPYVPASDHDTTFTFAQTGGNGTVEANIKTLGF